MNKLRQELINLHVDYVNPRYKNSHICVAAAILERRILTFEEYTRVCRSKGISMYELIAQEYFNAIAETERV